MNRRQFRGDRFTWNYGDLNAYPSHEEAIAARNQRIKAEEERLAIRDARRKAVIDSAKKGEGVKIL